jgi:hypothetical protein
MTDMHVEKVCVLCREDCSYKSRVRDSHGNYYCKTCHEEAEKQAEHRTEDQAANRAQVASNPRGDELLDLADAEHDSRGMGLSLDDSEDDGLNLETSAESNPPPPKPPAQTTGTDEMSGDLNTLITEEPSEPEAYDILVEASTPPSPLSGGDATTDAEPFNPLDDLFDKQAGAGSPLVIEPETKPVMSAPSRAASSSQPAAAPAGGVFWPFVIGFFALFLGGLGATAFTMMLLANLAKRADRAFIPDAVLDHVLVALVVPAMFIILGGWEALAGFILMLKKPIGAGALRYWARINVICVVTYTLAIIGYFVYALTYAENADSRALGLIGGVAIFLSIVGLVSLVWPIILLLWFRRETVQAEIQSWE